MQISTVLLALNCRPTARTRETIHTSKRGERRLANRLSDREGGRCEVHLSSPRLCVNARLGIDYFENIQLGLYYRLTIGLYNYRRSLAPLRYW